MTKAKIEVNNIENKIHLFEQNKCPTCGTPFTGDSFDKFREELHNELDSALQILDDAQKIYDGFISYKVKAEKAVKYYSENINKIINKKVELEKGKQNYISALNILHNNIINTEECSAIKQIIDVLL